jgi:hypothetical protein
VERKILRANAGGVGQTGPARTPSPRPALHQATPNLDAIVCANQFGAETFARTD